MSEKYILAAIAVIALVTIAIRFLPFMVFAGGRRTPRIVSYLGKVLPCAVMGMLVIYCLCSTSIKAAPHGIPELIAVLLTAVLEYTKKYTLLSIVCGTAAYMILIRIM